MQAQEPFDPYTALWSRLVDFRPEELSDLIATRRAVRAPSMLRRPSTSLTARDWLAPAARASRSSRSRGFRGSPFYPEPRGCRSRRGQRRGTAAPRRAAAQRQRPGQGPRGTLARPRSGARWATRSGAACPSSDAAARALGQARRARARDRARRWLGQPIGTDDAPRRDGPPLPRGVRAGERDGRPDLVLADAGLGPVLERSPARSSGRSATRRAASCSTSRTRRCRTRTRRPRSGSSRRTTTSYLSHKDRSRIIDEHASWTTAREPVQPRSSAYGSFAVDGLTSSAAGAWSETRSSGRLRSSRSRSFRWRRRRGGIVEAEADRAGGRSSRRSSPTATCGSTERPSPR